MIQRTERTCADVKLNADEIRNFKHPKIAGEIYRKNGKFTGKPTGKIKTVFQANFSYSVRGIKFRL
jgi:hypothetical protein